MLFEAEYGYSLPPPHPAQTRIAVRLRCSRTRRTRRVATRAWVDRTMSADLPSAPHLGERSLTWQIVRSERAPLLTSGSGPAPTSAPPRRQPSDGARRFVLPCDHALSRACECMVTAFGCLRRICLKSASGQFRHFERPLEMSAMPPIATKNGEPVKRRRRARSRRRAAARERQAPVEGPAPPLAWSVILPLNHLSATGAAAPFNDLKRIEQIVGASMTS